MTVLEQRYMEMVPLYLKKIAEELENLNKLLASKTNDGSSI